MAASKTKPEVVSVLGLPYLRIPEGLASDFPVPSANPYESILANLYQGHYPAHFEVQRDSSEPPEAWKAGAQALYYLPTPEEALLRWLHDHADHPAFKVVVTNFRGSAFQVGPYVFWRQGSSLMPLWAETQTPASQLPFMFLQDGAWRSWCRSRAAPDTRLWERPAEAIGYHLANEISINEDSQEGAIESLLSAAVMLRALRGQTADQQRALDCVRASVLAGPNPGR